MKIYDEELRVNGELSDEEPDGVTGGAALPSPVHFSGQGSALDVTINAELTERSSRLRGTDDPAGTMKPLDNGTETAVNDLLSGMGIERMVKR